MGHIELFFHRECVIVRWRVREVGAGMRGRVWFGGRGECSVVR